MEKYEISTQSPLSEKHVKTIILLTACRLCPFVTLLQAYQQQKVCQMD